MRVATFYDLPGIPDSVVALALFIMGKWLLKQITAALNSYVTAYAQQTANIDARIANLEKLTEEQARLTIAVESIKDDIAAQRKSHDNQWAFRKDVYVNLLTAIEYILSVNAQAQSCLHQQKGIPPDCHEKLFSGVKDLLIAASLAPLAASERVVSILTASSNALLGTLSDPAFPKNAEALDTMRDAFVDLRTRVQAAGRKDLWGTPEPEAKG